MTNPRKDEPERYLSILRACLAGFSVLCLSCSLHAAPLTPEQEARAHALERQIRCVACAGESIAESRAPMADAMRAVVHEQLQAGASDKAVFQYLRDRYGDEVLQTPPFSLRTLPLWLLPLAVLLSGGWLAWGYARRQGKR
jgi:cytochrome c-type biogenesis protein CcmH